MQITFYFPDDAFDLTKNCKVGFLTNAEYEALGNEEKLQTHKTDLAGEVEAILKSSHGLSASSTISSVKSNKLTVHLSDFKLPSKKVDLLLTDVEYAISFHVGMKLTVDQIDLSLVHSTITR